MKPSLHEEKALISLENKLTAAASKAYPHLSMAKRHIQIDEKAARIGKDRGKKLTIRKGLHRNLDQAIAYHSS